MDEERLLIAPDEERENIREVNELLAASVGTPALVTPGGKKIELSHSVHRVLLEAVQHLSRGVPVQILPLHSYLTTQQAANLLNVSRPYLIGLLENGYIPFHKVGKHRRVLAEDLIVFKDQRDTERRQALQDVIEESEALGLYDMEDG
jgi:excisionase family DNA binding protein